MQTKISRNSRKNEIENKKKFISLLPFILLFLICFNPTKSTNLDMKLNNKILALNKNSLISSSTISTKEKHKDKENTLSISGSAIEEIEPNLIKIGIKIESLNKVLKNSYDENRKVSNLVTGIFTDKKIKKENISTTNYEIAPIYEKHFNPETNKHTTKFKGYKVSNEIEVQLDKKLIAQELIDNIVLQGPVYITYVKFVYTDELVKKTKDSLLAQAAKNALNLAKKVSNVLTLKVEDVKNINIDDFVYPRENILNYNYDSRYIKSTDKNDSFKMPPPHFYGGSEYVTMNVKAVFVIMKKN